MNSKFESLGLAAVVAFFAFLCVYRLNFPPQKIYDEMYQATTAEQFMGLNGFMEASHPPLGETWSAFFLMFFGDFPWVWRLTSVLSGVGSLIVLFFAAEKLTRDSLTALFAAILFACDGVSLVMARIGMIHAPMLFLMLLSVLALLPYGVENRSSRVPSFFTSGILFGLALGTRWMAAGILGVLILLIFWRWRSEEEKSRAVLDFLIYFVLPALASYAASYTILLVMGKYQWFDVWRHQGHMLHYHVHLKEGHPYASKWWGWPFLLRPLWFYLDRSREFVRGIACMGNPAVFWLIPAALGFAFWDLAKHKSKVAAFVLTGFFFQWLLYVFIERVTFFHYIYPMLPFTALAIAYFLRRVTQMGAAGRTAVTGYFVLVIGLFFFWYPLLTAYPVSENFFQKHLWFRSWI